ncbi:HXXEE domain-containing protein [Leuconostocaceae bacterium ESL0958]|nr:HXXEE domain-containing protein [Leuconostocaceae bacterium ESL0958]
MTNIIKKILLSHFYVDMLLFIYSVYRLATQWTALTNDHRLAYALFIAMCGHQLEEYRFPGGFVWGFNRFLFKSTMPNRYPGNRLGAVIVDLFAMFLAAPFLYWHYSTAMAMCFAIFALIEVLGHTLFGVLALRELAPLGKETIYFPGSMTAFLLFAPLALIEIHELSPMMTANAWWWTVGILVAYFIFGFGLPTVASINKETPFRYDEAPEEGFYFHKYQQAK